MADAPRVKTPKAGQQASPEADPTHVKKQKRVKPKDAGEDKDGKDAQGGDERQAEGARVDTPPRGTPRDAQRTPPRGTPKDAQPKALTPKDAQPKAQPSPVSRRKLGVRSIGMACVHARALTLRPRSHTSREGGARRGMYTGGHAGGEGMQ